MYFMYDSWMFLDKELQHHQFWHSARSDLGRLRTFWRKVRWCDGTTVDGRNPAPVDRQLILFFTGFSTCQVVLDFCHQKYHEMLLAHYRTLVLSKAPRLTVITLSYHNMIVQLVCKHARLGTQNFHVFQKPKSSWVQKRFGFSNTGMHLSVPHINHGLNTSQGSSRAGLAVSLLPSAVWWFAFVVWIVLDILQISLHWLSYVLYSIVVYLCDIVMMYFKLIYSSFDEGLVLYSIFQNHQVPNIPKPWQVADGLARGHLEVARGSPSRLPNQPISLYIVFTTIKGIQSGSENFVFFQSLVVLFMWLFQLSHNPH